MSINLLDKEHRNLMIAHGPLSAASMASGCKLRTELEQLIKLGRVSVHTTLNLFQIVPLQHVYTNQIMTYDAPCGK